ncbi:MAG: vWA domain-containing protein [Elusimicrobiota bacterium]
MRMKKFTIIKIVFLCLFVITGGCDRSRKGPMSEPSSDISSIDGSIMMVDKGSFPDSYIFARIVDQNSDLITDFKLGNFNITEDDKPVIVNGLEKGQVSCAVVLVLDRSGSMLASPTEALNEAACGFIDKLPSGSMVEIIDFNSEVKVTQEFTTDKSKLKQVINSAQVGGGTSFYDAVAEAIEDAADIKGFYKMIIAMTDGEDNSSSKYELDSLIEYSSKKWQPIQVIGYGPVNETALRALGTKSNGSYSFASTGEQLKSIYENLVPEQEVLNIHYRSLSNKAKKVSVYVVYGSLTQSFSIKRD